MWYVVCKMVGHPPKQGLESALSQGDTDNSNALSLSYTFYTAYMVLYAKIHTHQSILGSTWIEVNNRQAPGFIYINAPGRMWVGGHV